jgi:hypothetical protein
MHRFSRQHTAALGKDGSENDPSRPLITRELTNIYDDERLGD